MSADIAYSAYDVSKSSGCNLERVRLCQQTPVAVYMAWISRGLRAIRSAVTGLTQSIRGTISLVELLL